MDTKNVEYTTEDLPKATYEELKLYNSKMETLYTTTGRLYMKRRELEEELKRVHGQLVDSEEEYKGTSDMLRIAIGKLQKLYPKGNIDLQTGKVTYPKSG